MLTVTLCFLGWTMLSTILLLVLCCCKIAKDAEEDAKKRQSGLTTAKTILYCEET